MEPPLDETVHKGGPDEERAARLAAICPAAARLLGMMPQQPGKFLGVYRDQMEHICARLVELATERDEAIRQLGEEARKRGLLEAEVERLKADRAADLEVFAAENRDATRIGAQAMNERDEALAEVERLRGHPESGPWPDCRDCGRAMVWTDEHGTSWMCPKCCYRRMEKAEAEVERLRAELEDKSDG